MGNEVTKPISIFPGAQVQYQTYFISSETQNNVEIIYIDPKKVAVKNKIEWEPKDFHDLCLEENNNILVGAHTIKIKEQTGVILIKNGKAKILDTRKSSHWEFAKYVQIYGKLIIYKGKKEKVFDGLFDYLNDGKARSIIALTKEGKLILFTFYHKTTVHQVQDFILKKFPKVIGAIELASGEKTASCINSDGFKNFLPPQESPKVFHQFLPLKPPGK